VGIKTKVAFVFLPTLTVFDLSRKKMTEDPMFSTLW